MSKIDNPTRKGRILSVRIEKRADASGDISHLGKYTDEPGPADRTIDREERGDRGRGEYRYFVAALSAEETGNPESVEQDYARAEAYHRREWGMVGIIAAAEICLPGSAIVQRITSGGLWNIESDSSAEHFEEIEGEQLGELEEELGRLGFTARQIEHAKRNLEHVER